jgi:hypothetical protein
MQPQGFSYAKIKHHCSRQHNFSDHCVHVIQKIDKIKLSSTAVVVVVETKGIFVYETYESPNATSIHK